MPVADSLIQQNQEEFGHNHDPQENENPFEVLLRGERWEEADPPPDSGEGAGGFSGREEGLIWRKRASSTKPWGAARAAT